MDVVDKVVRLKKYQTVGSSSDRISSHSLKKRKARGYSYLQIDNIVYFNDLQFCSIHPDSNKNTCKGKALNNNSKEFVKTAYGFETIEEANEYLLKRNKSPFYKHNHASEEDYKKFQTRDKEWFIKNNKSWIEYCERQAYTNKLEYFIELYGEIEGAKFYFDMNKRKDSSSLTHFVETYGDELGKQKFYEKGQKCENMSINSYIRKYGEVEGKNKYNYLRTLDVILRNMENLMERYFTIDDITHQKQHRLLKSL